MNHQLKYGIYNIPFDLDYKNVVDFSNGNRQAYFEGKLANYYQNILYIEKNGSVIVPLNIGYLKILIMLSIITIMARAIYTLLLLIKNILIKVRQG